MNADIQKLSKQLTRWYQKDFYLLYCFFTGFSGTAMLMLKCNWYYYDGRNERCTERSRVPRVTKIRGQKCPVYLHCYSSSL